jgi:hypothetical protein
MTDEMRCLRLREAKGNIILFIYKKNEAKREKIQNGQGRPITISNPRNSAHYSIQPISKTLLPEPTGLLTLTPCFHFVPLPLPFLALAPRFAASPFQPEEFQGS